MIMKAGTMARRRTKSEHYVNNKEFLAALIKYREDREIAQIQDKPRPVSYTHLTLPTSDLV
mgnify:CR=1 FL=1